MRVSGSKNKISRNNVGVKCVRFEQWTNKKIPIAWQIEDEQNVMQMLWGQELLDINQGVVLFKGKIMDYKVHS